LHCHYLFVLNYDAGLAAIPFLAAIGTVWLGMSIVHRYADPEEGGAMIGAGIAAMPCIGRAALRAPAQLHWDAGYVLVSIAIAMTFAAAARLVTGTGLGGRLIAVVLLILAIVGLHFTAMAAVTFVPDPLIAVPGHAIAPNVLAIAIATPPRSAYWAGPWIIIWRSGSGAARTIWRALSDRPYRQH
jgi:NO-binding membrane sensor protein with MHYT domain